MALSMVLIISDTSFRSHYARVSLCMWLVWIYEFAEEETSKEWYPLNETVPKGKDNLYFTIPYNP